MFVGLIDLVQGIADPVPKIEGVGEQARNRGFIKDPLPIIYSTHVRPPVDLFRLKRDHMGKGDGGADDYYEDRHSPDPDARFGRKSKKKSF